MTSRNSECSVLFVGLSVHLFNFCRVFICRIPAEKKGWQNPRNWDVELNNSSHSSLSSSRKPDCLLQSAFRFKSQFSPHDSTFTVLVHHGDQTIFKQLLQFHGFPCHLECSSLAASIPARRTKEHGETSLNLSNCKWLANFEKQFQGSFRCVAFPLRFHYNTFCIMILELTW